MMPIAVEAPIMAAIVDEAVARRVASTYIHAELGAAYSLEQSFYSDRPPRPAWRFLVVNDKADVVTGYVDVDAETGAVIPLEDEQRQDVPGRAVVMAAKNRKAMARDERGYILPFLAKIRVNGYLSSHVAFFASAHGQPTFVEGNPPIWRVATTVRLREDDPMVDLGVVDVDARTGDIIPLTEQQIQNMLRCADVAAPLQYSTTAAG